MVNFRCNAVNFFITYPNAGTLGHADLHSHLLTLNNVKNVYSCRELHENGEPHYHAIVQFVKKYDCRNNRYFDYEGRHANITAVRDLDDANTYIGKDGDTLGDPIISTKQAKQSTYTKALSTTTKREFMEILQTEDPRNYVLNYQRLQYFAEAKFGGKEPYTPQYGPDTFRNVPEACQKWVREQLFNGPQRPLNLILVGGPGLGKSEWARSLGTHHYWANRITPERVKDARYAVLDDMDSLVQWRDDSKGIWGSQRVVGIKVGNGVSGYRNWTWGIPSIWTFNQLPPHLYPMNSPGIPECYERQRSVIVEIESPLY